MIPIKGYFPHYVKGNFPRANNNSAGYNSLMTLELVNQRRKRIQARMEEVDISQRKLASEADLKETYIRDFLNGKSNSLDYDKAKAIAAVLKTTVQWIMDGEGDETAPQSAAVVDIWDSILDESQRKAWVDMGRSLADKDSKSG